MTEIKTCWAISAALKARCDMPAGHPGDHSISVSWDDSQCWNPVQDEPVPYKPAEVIPIKPDNKPEPCVACLHMHVGGDCKCGCYEHI